MTEKIMKCIVCNKKPKLHASEEYFSRTDYFRIWCENCYLNFNGKFCLIKQDAIKLWNKQQQRSIDRIKRLK